MRSASTPSSSSASACSSPVAPSGYREGVLILVPLGARARVREVMNEMGQVLRSWLLGQLVRSAVVAVVLAVTLHLLGLPGALCSGCRPARRTSFPISGR